MAMNMQRERPLELLSRSIEVLQNAYSVARHALFGTALGSMAADKLRVST